MEFCINVCKTFLLETEYIFLYARVELFLIGIPKCLNLDQLVQIVTVYLRLLLFFYLITYNFNKYIMFYCNSYIIIWFNLYRE